MKAKQQTIRLSEYRPFGWTLDETHLNFKLFDDRTIVESVLKIRRDSQSSSNSLRLDGEQLELEQILIDGVELSNNEYSIDEEGITLFDVPDICEVFTRVQIHPEKNASLEGLYKSSSLFCTQCEAESFRRITFYPDRPDVSSVFTTTIEADKKKFPNLLSNGNLIAEEDLPDNRHQAIWYDPYRKPCYLFALVAGNLSALEDEFITCSGRKVRLTIYTEPKYKERCRWAMDCLKRAMKWDEEVYGREYDLDRFMIVAVEDFNFGAMENKGLNIFNVSALLASPDTTTDRSYSGIEGVVAHEYFHNWSGNRVTCRDWFQISLKEGFTVFRDTQFSEAMVGETIVRIDTVNNLRTAQFPEDASSLAHPVRPDEYAAVTNFYTATVYEKGAEVLRMMYIMAGKERWRKATDLYFDRHDGCAVTIEDFVAAVRDGTELDLEQFFFWYTQSGTPRLKVAEARNEPNALKLKIEQSCPPTPNQANKQTFHIPVSIGVIDENGREVLGKEGESNGYTVEVESEMHTENPNADGSLIVHLRDAQDSLSLRGVPENSTVSFLRGFSAPVYVDFPQTVEQLSHLALHDTDGFVKWNALQTLYGQFLLDRSIDIVRLTELVEIVLQQLSDEKDVSERKSLLNRMLVLPSVFNVLDEYHGSDFDVIVENRDFLLDELAKSLVSKWEEVYVQHADDQAYSNDSSSVNRRTARNTALSYLSRELGKRQPQKVAILLGENFNQADNLTDRLANVRALLELPEEAQSTKDSVLHDFYQRFADEPQVINQWFAAQAMCSLPGAIERVRVLEDHNAFNVKNPNRVRSLFGSFIGNYKNFHENTGKGYHYIAEKVLEIESFNVQVAARLATVLTRWKRFSSDRQSLMKQALQMIEQKMTSKDVGDVVTRGLQD